MTSGRRKRKLSVLSIILVLSLVLSLFGNIGMKQVRADGYESFTLYYQYEGSETLYVNIWSWNGIGLSSDTVYSDNDPMGWGKELGILQAVEGNTGWYSVTFDILDASADDGFTIYAGSEAGKLIEFDNNWNNTSDYEVLVSGDFDAYAYTADGVTSDLEKAGLNFGSGDEDGYSDGKLVNGDFSEKDTGWTFAWPESISDECVSYKTDEWLTDPENQFIQMTYYPADSTEAADVSVYQYVKNLSGSFKVSLDYMSDADVTVPVTLYVQDSNGGIITSTDLPVCSGWNVWDTVETEDFDIPEDGIIQIRIEGKFLQQYVNIDSVVLQDMSTPAEERIFDLDTEVSEYDPVKSDIYLEKVDLMNDFATGFDLSSYLSIKESDATYKDKDGYELSDEEFFDYLAQNGVNYVRVRCWVDPTDGEGHTYGGGNCTVETVKEIGRLATDAGMRVLVDFHYSDFWTDPGKQTSPKAWADLELAERAATLKQYTIDSLQEILDAGVDVGMVQIGNETINGICGVTSVSDMCELFKAGSEGVQEIEKENGTQIMIVIHVTNPEKGNCVTWAKNLQNNAVVYDVLATSYYPYWHGTLENLYSQLDTVASTYGKYVMVAETSYVHTLEDGDGHENTESEGKLDIDTFDYEISPQGQALAIRSVTNVVASIPDHKGIGVFWWEPAWIPVQHYDPNADNAAEVLAKNKDIWENIGSGWATSYAADYDKDVGEWYGGSSVDNEGVFDFDGQALENVAIFNMIRGGTTAEDYLLEIKDAEAEFEEGEDIVLPGTVSVVMASGKSEEAEVIWDEDAVLEAKESGVGKYVISGKVTYKDEDFAVLCNLTIKPYNYLINPGVEDEDMTMWNISASYLGRKADSSNTRSGSYTMHFWDGTSAEFEVNQKIKLEQGCYKAGTFFEGADLGDDAELTFFVKVGDGELMEVPFEAKGWQVWQNPEIDWFYVPEDDTEVTIGAKLTNGAGGAWGAFDDWYVYSAEQEEKELTAVHDIHRIGTREDVIYTFSLNDETEIADIMIGGERPDAEDYTIEIQDGTATLTIKADALSELGCGGVDSSKQYFVLVVVKGINYTGDLHVEYWRFKDVTNPKSWYFDSVRIMNEMGIMTGDPLGEGEIQTTFRPNDSITRAEFATLLYGMNTAITGSAGEIYGDSPFTDVTNKDAYYYEPCIWAYENGIVVGKNGKDGSLIFDRKSNITRVEMAQMLRAYAETMGMEPEYDENMDFSDYADGASVKGWKKAPMSFAVTYGLISGNEDKETGAVTLDCSSSATRAMTAAIVYRFIQAFVSPE